MSEPLRMIEFQINILPDREMPTVAQLEELFSLGERWKADVVKAGTGGGGLSPTYIGFSAYRHAEPGEEGRAWRGTTLIHLISGGIDQEGRVST